MNDELKSALELLSSRGAPAGATVVVDRALDVDVLFAVDPPTRRRFVGPLALAVVVALVLGVAYVRSRASELRRIDVAAALDPVGKGPVNVLVVGSDARDGVSGARADVIMLVRVDPATHRASLLSVPRDVWVPIAETDRGDRLSNAPDPTALITAVRQTLGVSVDHYVSVGFDGFRRIVDAVGGIKLPFPAPTRDTVSGFNAEPGCVTLGGDRALAFIRSRHMETFEDGTWRADPTGDIGRIQREQQLVHAAFSQVRPSPTNVKQLVDAVVANTTVDSAFSTKDILRLVKAMRTLDVLLRVPTRSVSVGGAAVLEVDHPAVDHVVTTFNASVSDVGIQNLAPTHACG